MYAVWPASLPARFNAGSYKRTPGDGRLRSRNDTGPAKVRRRSAAVPSKLSGAITMRTGQALVFRDFVELTLMNGVLPFYFPDPQTETPILVRFGDNLPDEGDYGFDTWTIMLSLEVMP
ncbi:hypothetical protein [Bosea sp. ASV33]|uniref:hypothetical protein n=1 Tax=Bosea sp. ASV33 TaxID=2795106 RepID=UPI0018EDF280|nr:hypothetical protein [Bosea sp. ASV33]